MLAILGIGFLLSLLFNGYLFEHIAVIVVSVISFVFMIVKTLFWDTGTFSFRQIQIDAWIHPDKYPLDYAYVTVTSLNAIRSGGWFGSGYGKTDLTETLPESYSTNVFPLICYEMGWLFAGLLILVYVVLSIEIFRVFHSELNRKRNYSAAIVLGVFAYITYEYALCILSSLNLLPDVARYLPFISYHGPWIIVLMVMVAFVLRITIRQIKEDKRDTKILNI
jgi:cell division protein FtsW (lipid II flippase)